MNQSPLRISNSVLLARDGQPVVSVDFLGNVTCELDRYCVVPIEFMLDDDWLCRIVRSCEIADCALAEEGDRVIRRVVVGNGKAKR